MGITVCIEAHDVVADHDTLALVEVLHGNQVLNLCHLIRAEIESGSSVESVLWEGIHVEQQMGSAHIVLTLHLGLASCWLALGAVIHIFLILKSGEEVIARTHL